MVSMASEQGKNAMLDLRAAVIRLSVGCGNEFRDVATTRSDADPMTMALQHLSAECGCLSGVA